MAYFYTEKSKEAKIENKFIDPLQPPLLFY